MLLKISLLKCFWMDPDKHSCYSIAMKYQTGLKITSTLKTNLSFLYAGHHGESSPKSLQKKTRVSFNKDNIV